MSREREPITSLHGTTAAQATFTMKGLVAQNAVLIRCCRTAGILSPTARLQTSLQIGRTSMDLYSHMTCRLLVRRACELLNSALVGKHTETPTCETPTSEQQQHSPLKWCEAHGGVHTDAILHCCNAAAVACT
jgi:hypothetical protein